MKKPIMTALGFMSLMVLAASAAMAQAPTAPGAGVAYGTAGCGLGSMLFGPKPGIIQILAATTNDTVGSQTFGITSGTSNCGTSGVPGASARNFVETNRAVVAKDIARGRGETIATLTALGGCRDAQSVGSSLQKNFKRIFPDQAIADRLVAHNVVSVLRSDESLSCRKL